MNQILTINSGRYFTFNNRRYAVCDLNTNNGKDENGNKYYLQEILPGDKWRILYNNLCWEMVKFKTIKAARRYVRDWDFLLSPLEW